MAAQENNSDEVPVQRSSGEIYGDKMVYAVVRDIYMSASYGEAKVRAVMHLPPQSQADNETLALAVQLILEKYFKLLFPPAEMMHLRAGRSVKFIEEGMLELPPRRVSILLAAEQRTLEVEGKPPEDGVNAYSELVFAWKKQSGVFDEQGNIDLKRLNTFPTCLENETLAFIHERTEGVPGVNCLGKKIKQRVGMPLKIKWNESVISRVEDPANPLVYQLMSKTSGVVGFSLARPGNPNTLLKLDILDTLTINGDVDYGIGDQGSSSEKSLQCTSNIIIKGNVRGVFSLQTTGYIRVSGSVDGKKVIAEEVMAEVVTSGCHVIAEKRCRVGNVMRAKIEAGTISLIKNSNESELRATDMIVFEKGASCLGLTVYTHRAEWHENRIAGQNTVYLGEELFVEDKDVRAELIQISLQMQKSTQDIKEGAELVVGQLLSLEKHIKNAGVKGILEIEKLLTAIKRTIVESLKSLNKPFDENLIPVCFKLQTLLGDKNFHESILRKVEVLISAVKKCNEILAPQNDKRERYVILEQRLTELRAEVDRLSVHFEKPRFVGSNGEVHLVCGNAKLTVNESKLPSPDFKVTYVVSDVATSLADGRLKVGDKGLASF